MNDEVENSHSVWTKDGGKLTPTFLLLSLQLTGFDLAPAF